MLRSINVGPKTVNMMIPIRYTRLTIDRVNGSNRPVFHKMIPLIPMTITAIKSDAKKMMGSADILV